MPTATEIIHRARASLRAEGRDRVRLGQAVQARGILGIRKAPRIVPVSSAWRVGILLISDEALFAVGTVVRAREQAIRGFTAQSQRARSELAAAARRGGFEEGESVFLDWRTIDLASVDAGGSSGPIETYDGVAHVRWSATGEHRPLEEYLAEYLR